jgi:hypothetical protein
MKRGKVDYDPNVLSAEEYRNVIHFLPLLVMTNEQLTQESGVVEQATMYHL